MTKTKIKKYIEQHRLWIATSTEQGECAEFLAERGRPNLVNADFFGQVMAFADFSGAKLMNADLRYADLTCASFYCADMTGANLTGSDLSCANLDGANLTGAIGLPDISWIMPGCMTQLNKIEYNDFWLPKDEMANFVQDSFGVFIEDSHHHWADGSIGKTFDMLIGGYIMRGIPDWVKYTGLKMVDKAVPV